MPTRYMFPNNYEVWIERDGKKYPISFIEVPSLEALPNPSRPIDIRFSVPDITDIIFNGDTTVILWADGEKTVVRKEEGKPNDPYAAFCAAVCKRLFGSTDKVMKIIESADRAKKAARRKEEADRLKESHRRENEENAAKNKKLGNRIFDAMVESEIQRREVVKRADEIMGARK